MRFGTTGSLGMSIPANGWSRSAQFLPYPNIPHICHTCGWICIRKKGNKKDTHLPIPPCSGEPPSLGNIHITLLKPDVPPLRLWRPFFVTYRSHRTQRPRPSGILVAGIRLKALLMVVCNVLHLRDERHPGPLSRPAPLGRRSVVMSCVAEFGGVLEGLEAASLRTWAPCWGKMFCPPTTATKGRFLSNSEFLGEKGWFGRRHPLDA